MNHKNVRDEQPRIVIAKIEMSWFVAINGKKTVEFDPKTNLIHGSDDGVKQSIAKAIDVMLCSDYENSAASLSCRHESKHPLNKRQSSVKIHLIGTSEFVLNGIESSQFHITRYFNKNDVDFVLIGVFNNNRVYKQSIQKFHHDLSQVEMLRSLDPFISTDCVPNGNDINQLIVKMIGLKECATTVNTMLNSYLVASMQAIEMSEINKMFTERFATVKNSMTAIRTLKCALITQQMEEIKENFPDGNEFGKHRRLLANDIKQKKLNKKLDVLQSIQDHRCKVFNAELFAERKAVEDLEKNGDQQRIACLDKAFKDFCTAFNTMVEQLNDKRAFELEVFENQRAGIEWQKVNDMNDPAQKADAMKKNDACIKKMVKIQKINNAGKTEQHLKTQMGKALQAVSGHIDAIKKIGDDFIEPAQKVFLFNRRRLSYYQKSMNYEIKVAIARTEMEKFYASDNWLHESQIEALQKGHEMLSVHFNEFRERFLGHIGQFIDINSDFNILRVVFPILSKDYLSAFIFSRKDVADNFVKKFLAANPCKTILAFGIDEWESDLEGDAPEGVPLDEKILAAETLQRYPFIKNFFRTFCITARSKDHKYCQELAAYGIYKIFKGNLYYDKTSMTRVKGAKDIDYLKAVVEKWVEMGKNLQSQLNSGYEKCVANKIMDDYQKQMVTFETELNKFQLNIGIRKEKILNILRTLKELVWTCDQSLKFKGECHVKNKVFHMKREWLKNPSELQSYKPIVLGSEPELILPEKAELEFLGEIVKLSSFYAKGFPQIVYQSEEFLMLVEWISNCENIESPNFQIEPQPNAISDDNIKQRLKRHSDLEAAYEKLLNLRNEQSLLSEHTEFCLPDSVEELAKKDRADLRRQLDHAQQNIPPGVILPGNDMNKIMKNLILSDGDTSENIRVVSAVTTQNCAEASWRLKPTIQMYFVNLLKILKLLNEFYDWKDQDLVCRLNAANGTKAEYIDHKNPKEMTKWIRNFTLQELCADDTWLSFYLKSKETGDYVNNDVLDIKRHALATLLHTVLSCSMNPSLFILNNTIVGHSPNEVADIIKKYRPNDAQLILFSRSGVDYRDLFGHPYKLIAINIR